MAYVSVPNDLSKVKTKVAFNLTKRQLLCFGAAAVIGIRTYLFTRNTLGGTASMLLMIVLMLPCFFSPCTSVTDCLLKSTTEYCSRQVFVAPNAALPDKQPLCLLSNPRKEVQPSETKRKKAPTVKKPSA